MAVRLLRLVPYRLRILLRATFVLLALATVGLAVSVLQQEKQLSYKNYQGSFKKTAAQIASALRHPSGQLALLNPPVPGQAAPLHPLLLPFAALDFDDLHKVQQAVDMSGCLVQYGASASLCVAVGSDAWVGAFIYVAGSVDSARLQPHRRGDDQLDSAHRVLVSVALRGRQYQWVAPFEESSAPVTKGDPAAVRGRLTGFNAADAGRHAARPVKDFRGWIWQSGQCSQSGTQGATCPRTTFYSLRLPVGVLQDALFDSSQPAWPPADLAQIAVRVSVLAPGQGKPLFDSSSDVPAAPAFALPDLAAMLLPGETLTIRSIGQKAPRTLVTLAGATAPQDQSWHVLTTLIRHLPVDAYDVPLTNKETIVLPTGRYEVLLNGDARSVSQSLSVVATRLAWFVGAMLVALLLAWLAIEVGIISRIKVLIGRADSVARTVKGSGALARFDLSDLRGEDELGVLAGCLHELLRRVREDLEREEIRAEQERDMWHAVGHEIMSPLQSLIALHGTPADQSHRYILRMQQAIRVLYGSASPSEAFQTTVLQVSEIDLNAFLVNVAANAPCVGIERVAFSAAAQAVLARADEYSLEDVVTHVLRNADRYRVPGSDIVITLEASESGASITIFNQGPRIDEQLIGRIFEYGVSDRHDSAANGSRGQGLFVAKTYMAKMGGTITAHNLANGVSFVLNLQRG